MPSASLRRSALPGGYAADLSFWTTTQGVAVHRRLYLSSFYVLDAYNVGAEDFKDTTGRILMALLPWRHRFASAFMRSSTGVSIAGHCCCSSASLCLLFCLGWRALYYKHIGRFVHKARILLIGTDRAGRYARPFRILTDADIVGYVGDCDNDREILSWHPHAS